MPRVSARNVVDDLELLDLVERAYVVFAGPPPRGLDGCGHCVGPDELTRFRNDAPRDLTDDDAGTLAANLALTLGDASSVRHFAPRIMAALVSGALFEPNFAGLTLERGVWTSWRSEETQAVRAVLAAWWRRTLLTATDGADLDDAICCIAQCETDLTPYLAAWDSLPERERSLALIRLVAYLPNECLRTERPTAFWDRRPAQWESLRRFVIDPTRLAQAASHLDDPRLGGIREEAAIVLDVLFGR